MLRISPVDKHSPATSGNSGIDVPPPVAHHKTSVEIDRPFPCSSQQLARLGFPAFTMVSIVVIADTELIYWHGLAEHVINGFNLFPLLRSSGHVGLVRHYNKDEAGRLQFCAGICRIPTYPHVSNAFRRIG